VFCAALWGRDHDSARVSSSVLYASELHDGVRTGWVLILSGAPSVIFGVLVFANPAAGSVALIWIIGWFALLPGILNVVAAFQLKKLKRA
jgi:uncharacterized membrane protein HdeD (DUF308 family)